MTERAGGGLIPDWTLGDRLRKARTMKGMTVQQLATQIGVAAKTINNAEGDKVKVRPITLNAWALATGVDLEWLKSGHGKGPDGPGPGKSTDKDPKTPGGDALARLTAVKRARAHGTDNGAYPKAA